MFEAIKNNLIKDGIAPAIAESMARSIADTALRAQTKGKKKKSCNPALFKPKREKITVPITVLQRCITCGTETSYRMMFTVYDDEPREMTCVVKLCVVCIKELYTESIDTLISIIAIQNHPDSELSNLPLKRVREIAQQRSPQEILLTHIKQH